MNVARGLAFVSFRRLSYLGVARGFSFLGAGTIAYIPVPVILVVAVYALFHIFCHARRWARCVSNRRQQTSGNVFRYSGRPAVNDGLRIERRPCGLARSSPGRLKTPGSSGRRWR